MSVDSPANNQGRGFGVEQAACERWPAERVDDDWRDLELVSDVVGSETGVTLFEAGLSVEVKSCQRRLSSGERGRIWIRRQTHERLLEAGGHYVVAVLDGEGEPLRLSLFRGSSVDALIGGDWWDCGDGGQSADQYRQLCWTNFFDGMERPEVPR